jgi:hypothetical protein
VKEEKREKLKETIWGLMGENSLNSEQIVEEIKQDDKEQS